MRSRNYSCWSLLALALSLFLAITAVADEPYFYREVWPKVGELTCLRCHTAAGDAADSQFVLLRPKHVHDAEALTHNLKLFQQFASQREGDASKLLLKVIGGLDHGGGKVAPEDSRAYRVLAEYVRRVQGGESVASTDTTHVERDFFAGITMVSPQRLLRRLTLSLVARLPTLEEQQQVDQLGQSAIPALVNSMMQEEAFYERLKEGWNDILLTRGIEDNAETLLSYDHFEHTRLWYQSFSLDHLPEADRQKARWKLADVYRDALLREPFELIAYIVRNERPFTEILTADYIMVSPYTARGYGIFDQVRERFHDPEDPFEYVVATLPALKARSGKVQESPTGLYPHAGLLSMFHYLRRYPSTETNRNRLRSRMVYQHFLGIDIMALAPRSSDAAAIAAKYEVPTMQAADCVVCHRTIDPISSIFQDYDFEGHLGPRKGGWYSDMFQAGFETESMPTEERWRATQWLAERIVRDPRFATAMVEHVYFILTGRKVLQPPQDIDDPQFDALRDAYRQQRAMVEQVAEQFRASNFNLKVAFQGVIASKFYQADGLSVVTLAPERQAELDDVGLVRLLSPEQLERKIAAIFGKRWGKLHGEMAILYGGIDSITVTERILDPSGAMGAVQRLMANDLACYHVARDFRLPHEDRRLFPHIEPSIVPGTAESDQQIKQAIVELHARLLGREDRIESVEVKRTFDLFNGVIADAHQQAQREPRETYFCGGREEFKTPDPDYTQRAWRAVVTYLLRQHEFLYE